MIQKLHLKQDSYQVSYYFSNQLLTEKMKVRGQATFFADEQRVDQKSEV